MSGSSQKRLLAAIGMPVFEFAPRQFVRVKVHGLNYSGRIARCIWDGGESVIYAVDYNADGELRRGEFYGDELEKS